MNEQISSLIKELWARCQLDLFTTKGSEPTQAEVSHDVLQCQLLALGMLLLTPEEQVLWHKNAILIAQQGRVGGAKA